MTPRQRPFANAGFGLAIAAGLLAAPLPPQTDASAAPHREARGQQCFYASNITNFTAASDRVVYIRVGVNDVYRLDLMNACPELSFRLGIGLSQANGGSTICSPIDLTIRYRQAGADRICPVRDMRKLSPDEVAALPKRDRP